MHLLRLLGSPGLERDGVVLTGGASQRHRLALLALLALSPGRRLGRDRLLAYLWPETEPERARNLLSVALYTLRSTLGDDAIVAVGDGLLLNAERVRTDVDEFDQVLAAGEYERAVAIHRGPLLDGFFLSDAPAFEQWVDRERERLASGYRRSLEALGDAAQQEGQFDQAAEWWRRRAGLDPYDSRVAGRLMEVLAAGGNPAGALQHAATHQRLLELEFGMESAEIAALAQRIRRAPAARSAEEPAPPGGVHGDGAIADVASSAGTTGRRSSAAVRLLAAGALLLGFIVVVGLGLRAVATPDAPAERSVGVLPFVNMSADPENTYFSDGLTEQIIAALSRMHELRVAARTSSFALRDRGLDVRAIGETLGVAAVLEGSVRRDGNRVRVTAQLIDARSGYHIWTDEYDREMRDLIALQDEIAHAIAGALDLSLGGAGPRTPHVESLEAYDLYLRGLYLRNTLRGDALRRAVDLFDRAIELEPDFAAAYAAKASVVAPLIYFGHEPLASGVAQLRATVDSALALDSTSGEAHAALGMLRLFFEWDWEGAERALRRAIELNPSDPHAWHHLANYFDAIGHREDAIAARERSVELDPLNARTRIVLGRNYLAVGDAERSAAAHRRAQELDPVHPIVLGLGPEGPAGLAEVHLARGDTAQAVEDLLRVAALRRASAAELGELRSAYTASGMRGFWRRWIEMDVRQSGPMPDPVRLALLWAQAGDDARALALLERAYAERNPGLIFLRREPAFERLQSHPRFVRIAEGMRLPGP